MCLVPLFLHERRISCGKCPECLNAQRGDWNYRAEQELKHHKFCYFFTFTFNPDHLPPTDELVWQRFGKFRIDLWKRFGQLKYFTVIEHGDKNGRVHLHMLLFADFAVSKDVVRRLWPDGFIKRSKVTPKRIRYTTVYMFKQSDMYNKVRMYRASNGFGDYVDLPYRVRWKNGRPSFVPLPRYYCKKYPAAKQFAQKYYDNLYHDNDFNSVYEKCRYRYGCLRAPYGKPRITQSYEDYLVDFCKARVQKYKTFKDPRDLIAFPGPDHYRGLSRTYSQLLRRVEEKIEFYGSRRSGNLRRYLTIDCPMFLRDAKRKIENTLSPPKKFFTRLDFFKKQLTFF